MSATQHIVVGNTKRRKENSPALFLNEFIVFCHLNGTGNIIRCNLNYEKPFCMSMHP